MPAPVQATVSTSVNTQSTTVAGNTVVQQTVTKQTVVQQNPVVASSTSPPASMPTPRPPQGPVHYAGTGGRGLFGPFYLEAGIQRVKFQFKAGEHGKYETRSFHAFLTGTQESKFSPSEIVNFSTSILSPERDSIEDFNNIQAPYSGNFWIEIVKAEGDWQFDIVPAAEASNGPVRDVAVLGLRTIATDTVLQATAVKIGDTISAKEVDAAIARVYGLGTFERVDARSATIEGGVRLTFTVVENPLLADVAFDGVTKVELAELETTVASMKGKIINFNAVKEAIDKIQKLYSDSGYPLARVAQMNVVPGGDLHFRIAEGKIAAIKVRGIAKVSEDLVLREMETKPGEIFNREKVNADLRRVYNLNYFTEINIKFEPATTADGKASEEVIFVVEVVERP